MSSPLRLLAILCWVAAAILLISYYYFPYNPDPVQTLWDYIIDPIVIGTLILVIVANTRISLEHHNAGNGLRHLPMDIMTMLTAFFAILYLHQYVLKFAEGFEPAQLLWDLLVPGVVIFMVVSAISYAQHSRDSA